MESFFTWIDYALFVLMLAISAVIGVYYGFFKVQNSANEYLLGGKKMNTWPIALSLISSCISGIPLLTFPTEVYYYGIGLALSTPLIVLVSLVTYYVYLPVFFKLQVTSTYEYFSLRFDNRLRVMASIFYTLYMVLYLPLVVYVPALALSQVTGINTHVLTPIICGVCIFYTTFGGLKAVVWTDALQFIVMIGSMMVVVVVGVISVGGVGNIWKIASEEGRLNLSFSLDPTLRDTFWTGIVAALIFWIGFISTSQSTVQKCLSLSSFKEVRNAFCIFTVGLFILLAFINFSGMAMLAKYHDCDPVLSGKISKRDQLLPYYVVNVAGHLPGLPGLFVSGILSAGLSTLSAAMNCLAATIYEDFLKPFMSKEVTDRRVSIILKCLVLFIGIASTALVYVMEHLGNLLPIAMSFLGMSGGPLLGLFSVGMLVPMVNSKGALWGGITSLAVMMWIVVAGQFHRAKYPYQSLPVSTENCTNQTIFSTTSSTLGTTSASDEDGFFLFRISHFYYTLLGVLIVFIVSIVVSWFTRTKEHTVDRDLISPVVYFFLPNRGIELMKYHTVDEALTIVQEKS